MRFYLFFVLLGYTVLQAQPTIPPPTQTDEIIIDNGATGKADPNDRIRYKVTIQNTGTTGATGTQLNIVPDPRTTFLAGTFRSSPLALADSYTSTGNVGIIIPVASGLKANDFDDNIPGLTITAGTFATTQGGSIMISADGSFMYTPAAGFTGIDTYTYTLNDANGVGGGVPTTDMATVTITVSNLIWFIDNSSVAATSDGRLSSPFKTIANFNAGSTATASVVYIEHTGTNYTGPLTLQTGERLYGEGHSAGGNLSGVLPFSLAPNSKTLPTLTAGNRPIITSPLAGIALASNNEIRGLEVGSTSLGKIVGTSFGTLLVGNTTTPDVLLSGPGPAVDLLTGTFTATSQLISTSSSSSNRAISLESVDGTVNFGTGTITGSTNAAFYVLNGTVTTTYSGSITPATLLAINIINHETGNMTFQTGNITSTAGGISISACNSGTILFSNPSISLSTGAGNAIDLDMNSGGTINFTGGNLVLITTGGIAFDATGGGTVNITGTGNTINSGAGTALNVVNTTIGVSNLNFQSITSIGGSAPGIVLNTTGVLGGLIVNGDGSNTTKGGNGTGGTIANKADGGSENTPTTGTAIYLNNTSNVILRRMQINDCQNFGLRGLSVGNLTFQYCTISGLNGDGVPGPEGCLSMGTSNPGGANGFLNGSVSLIDNCKISGGVEHNTEFYNQSNSFSLTLSNTDITDNTVASGSDGVLMEMQGTASATMSVQSCFFDDNKSQPLQAAANDDSTIDITINSCTVIRSTQGNEGFVLSNGSNGDLTAHVTNNNLSGLGGVMIFVGQTPGNATSSSNLIAVIKNNVLSTPASATNHAIIAFLTSTVGQVSQANILIESNTIAQNSTSGTSRPFLVDTPDNNTTPNFTATVLNNNVTFVDPGTGASADVTARRGTGCFDVRGNIVAGPFGIRVRQVAPATVNLEQGSSGSMVPATVLDDNHPAGTVTSVLGIVSIVGNSTCQSPPN